VALVSAVSQPLEPVPFVLRSMQDCKNNHGVRPDDIKDSIWESPRKYAADVWLLAQKQICQRVFERALDGSMNLSSELQSQAHFSAFIPEGSVKNVTFGFRADN
jgi:hypothetical protein